MKLFLHTLQRVRILNGDLEWSGTPAEFLVLEPEYPGLPTLSTAPAVLRYCTPEWSYVEDSNGTKHTNTVDCLDYCDKVADYIGAAATLWIHYDFSVQSGFIPFQSDGVPLVQVGGACVLRVTATVRATDDPESAVVEQLNQGFPIRMCYKDGREAFIRLVSPVTPGVFQVDLGFENEMPVRHRLFDADFQAVELDGVTYAIKQVTPLIIDAYTA